MAIKNQQIALAAFLLLGIMFTIGCRWDYYETIERPENVSFSDHIMPIFNANCNMSGCHATASPAPDLSPQNAYNSLINSGMIDATNPTESTLYKRMNSSTSPMPIGGKLPEITVTTVLVWIEEGAQDN